MRTTLYS